MKAWYLGNTTIRSLYRLKDGLRVLVNSPLHGYLHGRDNESRFAQLLDASGVVDVKRLQQEGAPDASDVGRKWRAALTQLGFLTPKLSRTLDPQGRDSRLIRVIGDLPTLTGRPYEVTPNGQRLIDATTVAGMQECFLRSLVGYQILSLIERQVPLPVFSPLRVVLEVLVGLEQVGLESAISFGEMAWIVQFVRSLDECPAAIQRVQAYRAGREQAENKDAHDRIVQEELAPLLEGQSLDTLIDYADCNMRYLKATGLFSSRGRKLLLAEEKRALITQLRASPFQALAQDAAYLPAFWNGVALPTDHEPEAIAAIRALVRLLTERGEEVVLPELAALPVQELTQIRLDLEERLKRAREREFAQQQRANWENIVEYLRVLAASGRSRRLGILSGEAPAYLEWVLWRAFLAINSLVNDPWEARRFQVDQDFLPVGTAPGGGPDLIFEFPGYVLVVEVTLTTSSRQEAAEGEPVRRHVASVVERYEHQGKDVYGLFIANTIDSNTAETFRVGIWYRADDSRMALRIVPLTLTQFADLFEAGFQRHGLLEYEFVEQVLRDCRVESNFDAPEWKHKIEQRIRQAIQRL
jgi:ElaB/YqjD/DUF883 family membrane-anchored ribosome-binding protein